MGQSKEGQDSQKSDGIVKKVAGQSSEQSDSGSLQSSKDVADTSGIRLQRRSEKQVHGQRNLSQQSVRSRQGKLTQRPSQSRLGGMVNGLPNWMDEPSSIPRTTGPTKGRAARLKGLGNAIVPGIAQRIGETIKQCEAEL